jgi:hypothetical protein
VKLGVAGRLSALSQAVRPCQWTKNLALFVGLVFAQKLLNPTLFERAALAFPTFCLAASSIYLFNDLLDLACSAISIWCMCAKKAEVLKRSFCVIGACSEPLCCV